MEPIHFEVGSEKRFYEWISRLDDKDKIALISHNDLDGVASAKVVNEVVDSDFLKLVNYEELKDDLIVSLKRKGIKKLILTDLTMDDAKFAERMSKEFEILWIDHHKIIQDFNSEKIVYMNPGGNNTYCAAYICYYLFSKIQNIGSYDWLVACACLSDFTIYKNREWMQGVFRKYGDKSEIKSMSLEDGPIQNLKRTLEFAIIYFKTEGALEKVLHAIGEGFGNIGDLENRAAEVEREVESVVQRFEKEAKEINGRLIFEFEPRFGIGQITSNTVSVRYPNKTIITLRPIDEKRVAISMRRQDSGEDMEKLMKSALQGLEDAGGGGHIPAAGGHFLRKDLEKFKERLKQL